MLTLGSGRIYVADWYAGASTVPSATYVSGTPTSTQSQLFEIGEIAGDVEFTLEFQEREFYGQSNFAIQKAYFGGKCELNARRVELNLSNLQNFWTTGNLAARDTLTSYDHDVTASGLPRPLYVKFVHTRSDDPTKTVTVHLYKAFSPRLTFPFTREDITTMDLSFMGVTDRDVAGAADKILLVEAA
jgi:hypothetical protein